MSGNTASRHVNGILGLLCRTHFPGMVMHAGNLEPAFMFAHYESAPHVEAGTVAALVIREFWVSLPRTTWLNTTHSLDST